MCDIQTSYRVAGMTCGSCATKVTDAVGSVPGVTGTGVDVSTGSLTVSGHPEESAVRAAIEAAGYAVLENA